MFYSLSGYEITNDWQIDCEWLVSGWYAPREKKFKNVILESKVAFSAWVIADAAQVDSILTVVFDSWWEIIDFIIKAN